MLKWLLRLCGFKEHLFHCPDDLHVWQRVYGDEIRQVDGLYLCLFCPQRRDAVEEWEKVLDPMQTQVDQLRERYRRERDGC